MTTSAPAGARGVVYVADLAAVVERNLAKLSGCGTSATEEVRDALEFFRDVAEDRATR